MPNAVERFYHLIPVKVTPGAYKIAGGLDAVRPHSGVGGLLAGEVADDILPVFFEDKGDQRLVVACSEAIPLGL